MLDHIVAAAESAGVARLSLETGSWPYFEPARALYASAGFTECGPFGGVCRGSQQRLHDAGAAPACNWPATAGRLAAVWRVMGVALSRFSG